MDEEEARELLQACIKLKTMYKSKWSRDIAIIALFIYAGLRRKELLNLKLTDLNLERSYIKVFAKNKGLGRLMKYLFSWSMDSPPMGLQKYAIWNAGTGVRGYPQEIDAMFKMITDDSLVFAGGLGISGGASFSIPTIFFSQKENIFKQIKNLHLIDEDTINNDACYVLSGESTISSEHKVWISKRPEGQSSTGFSPWVNE